MYRLAVARLDADPGGADFDRGLLLLDELLEALERIPTAHLNLALTARTVAGVTSRPALCGRLGHLHERGALGFVASTTRASDSIRGAVDSVSAVFGLRCRPQLLWPDSWSTASDVVESSIRAELAAILCRRTSISPADDSGRTLATLSSHPGFLVLPVDEEESRMFVAGIDEAEALLSWVVPEPALGRVVAVSLTSPGLHPGGFVLLLEEGRTLLMEDLAHVVRGRRLVTLRAD
ncbi:MAG: hypothetical protein RL199_843 [Pseudomonadota bacterium]|jgi:hypothetical protein